MSKKKKRSLPGLRFGFLDRIREDHVAAYAAEAAYFLIMSFIPFILFLTSIIQYTPLTYSSIREVIISFVPENLQAYVLSIISEIYGRNGAIVPIAVLTTLWSAGKGMQAIINGLNVIYHVDETRGWLVNRIYSIFWTVLFVVALIGSLLILVLGDGIIKLLMKYLPLVGKLVDQVLQDKNLVAFAVLFIIFELLYKVLPNRKARFRSQIPGALFTAIVWTLFSKLFSMYFKIFPNFMNLYGSMAAVILVMIWLDICMIIMLAGAEINEYFESYFRKAGAKVRKKLTSKKGNAQKH